MNLIRTIRREEDPEWVRLNFVKGPHVKRKGRKRVPGYPPNFPFPIKIRQAEPGDSMYLLFNGRIIGYGRIRDISHSLDTRFVGTEEQEVRPGDTVYLKGPLRRMPFELAARGFTGARYTEVELHEVDKQTAQRALNAALGVLGPRRPDSTNR